MNHPQDFDDVLREVVGGSATSGAIFDVGGKPHVIKMIERIEQPQEGGVQFQVRVTMQEMRGLPGAH